MAKTKMKDFQVGHIVKIWVETTITATTLEEATTIGRAMKLEELVEINGQQNDSSVKLIQVFDGDDISF